MRATELDLDGAFYPFCGSYIEWATTNGFKGVAFVETVVECNEMENPVWVRPEAVGCKDKLISSK